ncbi:MAG: hypothetical protein QW493_01080 [Candidatus Bathyarchaeia archaeon]
METRKKEYVDLIKENISKRANTDKVMWFSMWFLLTIITFGFALFPMIYFLIERRNRHFQRQKELEDLILSVLKGNHTNLETETTYISPKRNALLWTLSAPLIVPVFLIAYHLSKDLLLHERRQKCLFNKILPDENIPEQKINPRLYLLITIVTMGVGMIYWFYKIFNAYNNHFKEQWKIENRLIELFEGRTDKYAH